jgi:hypothetical protein
MLQIAENRLGNLQESPKFKGKPAPGLRTRKFLKIFVAHFFSSAKFPHS